MSYWEKSVITVTDLQNTADFYPASHNDSIHPSGSSTLLLAVLCCVFMCCLRFALRKQPWNHQRSFSLASRCHVVSANTWHRQGDVCIAREAVTTLPSVLSCSSPAECHTVEVLGLPPACHSYCWGHNRITSLRLLSQLNIHLKNVMTYTSQRRTEIK